MNEYGSVNLVSKLSGQFEQWEGSIVGGWERCRLRWTVLRCHGRGVWSAEFGGWCFWEMEIQLRSKQTLNTDSARELYNSERMNTHWFLYSKELVRSSLSETRK